MNHKLSDDRKWSREKKIFRFSFSHSVSGLSYTSFVAFEMGGASMASRITASKSCVNEPHETEIDAKKFQNHFFPSLFSLIVCRTLFRLRRNGFSRFFDFHPTCIDTYARKHPNSRLRAIERMLCRRSRHLRRRNLINFQFFFFSLPLWAQRKGGEEKKKWFDTGHLQLHKIHFETALPRHLVQYIFVRFYANVFLRLQCFSSSFALV